MSLTVRLVAPQVVAIPLVAEALVDIEVGKAQVMRWAFDLDVAAGPEIHDLALGQLEHELLDEGRDVPVRHDLATILFHAEYFVGYLDAHVLLDRNLARQSVMFGCIAFVD